MKRGAVAVLNVIEQTGNMHVRDFGNCGGPCFNLGGADGAFVEAAIQKATAARTVGEIRAQLRLQSETLAGLTGHNAVGVIPGASAAPGGTAENIIVNAHADGWFDASGDNADGLAVLVAMARHFARPENRLDRTLVFVASGGHHSTGLNGPANFVKMNAALTSKTVLVLNLEHIAQFQIRPVSWRVEQTEQADEFRDCSRIAAVERDRHAWDRALRLQPEPDVHRLGAGRPWRLRSARRPSRAGHPFGADVPHQRRRGGDHLDPRTRTGRTVLLVLRERGLEGSAQRRGQSGALNEPARDRAAGEFRQQQCPLNRTTAIR